MLHADFSTDAEERHSNYLREREELLKQCKVRSYILVWKVGTACEERYGCTLKLRKT